MNLYIPIPTSLYFYQNLASSSDLSLNTFILQRVFNCWRNEKSKPTRVPSRGDNPLLFALPTLTTTLDAMNDKFNDLPGIDTTSQEVFETSDTEADQAPAQVSNEEFLSSARFDESRKQFLNQVVTNRGFDFSGNVTNLSGYQVKEVSETREDKLSRIRRELDEMRVEDGEEEGDDDGGDEERRVPVVDELYSALLALKSNRPVKPKIFQADDMRLDSIFELDSPTAGIKASQWRQLGEFEQELSQLEKRIGPSDASSQSVQFAVNDLRRKLDTIEHPENCITAIEKQMESLFKEINKLELNKKVFGIEETPKLKVDKIDNIYNVLPNLKQYADHAPILLERLKTLNSVHNEIIDAVEFANSLDATIHDAIEDMKKWDQSINGLNEKIDSSKSIFESNQAKIEERVDELVNKVNLLQKKNSAAS
ncbi:uncharacterized protein LODBEIA_P54810 [Lodderomyces beijingensis]|uniref:Dynactin subunit 2 n=1 Tax=Lodderomyces beijingensis TaxID=1775926 RepID=A0ABP0ZV38_9ASCO